MTIGTKSLLFGAHQFILHPICLWLAWRKLRGKKHSFNPKLLIAFIVHDWGYWGKPNMDGQEGKLHPALGKKIMTKLFGEWWGNFTAYHSRSYAKLEGKEHSILCPVDKYAFCILPKWLYMAMIWLTGEWKEYMYNRVLAYEANEYIPDELAIEVTAFLYHTSKENFWTALGYWYDIIYYKSWTWAISDIEKELYGTAD